MYTLYQIDPKNLSTVKVQEGTRGLLAKKMNYLRSSQKSNLYAIYDRNGSLISSMLNK